MLQCSSARIRRPKWMSTSLRKGKYIILLLLFISLIFYARSQDLIEESVPFETLLKASCDGFHRLLQEREEAFEIAIAKDSAEILMAYAMWPDARDPSSGSRGPSPPQQGKVNEGLRGDLDSISNSTQLGISLDKGFDERLYNDLRVLTA